MCLIQGIQNGQPGLFLKPALMRTAAILMVMYGDELLYL